MQRGNKASRLGFLPQYSLLWLQRLCESCNFWVCSSDKMIPFHNDTASRFLRLSKVWSMLHHGTVRWVQYKEYFFSFLCLFFFHHKINAFIIFISFFDEVSNFCGRISTSQIQDLVVQNCHGNCMFYMSEIRTHIAHRTLMTTFILTTKPQYHSVPFLLGAGSAPVLKRNYKTNKPFRIENYIAINRT